MFIDPSTTKTKLRWSGTFALLQLPHVAPAGASIVLLCFSYKHSRPRRLPTRHVYRPINNKDQAPLERHICSVAVANVAPAGTSIVLLAVAINISRRRRFPTSLSPERTTETN